MLVADKLIGEGGALIGRVRPVLRHHPAFARRIEIADRKTALARLLRLVSIPGELNQRFSAKHGKNFLMGPAAFLLVVELALRTRAPIRVPLADPEIECAKLLARIFGLNVAPERVSPAHRRIARPRLFTAGEKKNRCNCEDRMFHHLAWPP